MMSSVPFCTHLGYIALEFNSRDKTGPFSQKKTLNHTETNQCLLVWQLISNTSHSVGRRCC